MRRPFEFLGLTALFCLCLGGTFLAGYYARAWSAEVAGLRWNLPGLPAEGGYPLLDEVRSLLARNFNGNLPDALTLERGAARGYVAAVNDPYTVFIEPQAAEIEANSLQGEYGGIGVELSQTAAGEIALKPFLDSPAEAAGVAAGDILLRVDDHRVEAATTLEAVTAWLRGPVGTTVRLALRQAGGAEAEFVVTRQTIALPSVTWRMVPDQAGLGLIAISRFSDRTLREVQRAAEALGAQGAQRYILDLRDNGGGLLDAAVNVAGEFLGGGVVMYETSRTGEDQTYTAPDQATPLKAAPLAVLVNGNTASAAEILAGALLDRGRAPLIGQKTFGKGSVQYVFPLSDGSSLHVTANLWFTPSRRQLDRVGLPPTFETPPPADGADPALQRAIDYLNTGQ